MIKKRGRQQEAQPQDIALSHSDLVKKAVSYLRYQDRHTIVLSEFVTNREIPDAIGFYGGFSTLIECKISRADFLADNNKYFRTHPEEGVGDKRYFMIPRGLIKVEELPAGWGLIEIWIQGEMPASDIEHYLHNPGKIRMSIIKESELFKNKNKGNETLDAP